MRIRVWVSLDVGLGVGLNGCADMSVDANVRVGIGSSDPLFALACSDRSRAQRLVTLTS